EPLVITPLYDEPGIVSDEELAAVLKQLQPRFPPDNLRPNHVEHALRTWHVDAEFQDPSVMSGPDMRDLLLDNGRFLLSWGPDIAPLLEDRPTGVYVRWGHEQGASVHHDHTLACLSEAGVPLDQPVRSIGRPNGTLKQMIEQAIYDFDLDERETEWSAMAFGLWLPTVKEWENSHRRKLSFDMIARRQMRGHKTYGVCGGTHRVYSLMALVRLDDEFDILSDDVHAEAMQYLRNVRDILAVTQFEDGHWPYNWPDGEEARTKPSDLEEYKAVIATGHHLEWLAIAPKELHPPREMIEKAADWIINNTVSKTPEQILDSYTFYSHVGNALSLWRRTRAPVFWKKWEADHPYQPDTEETHQPTDTEQPATDSGDVTTQEAATDADAKPANESPTEVKPAADPAKDPNPAAPEPLQVPILSTDSE
ncbi:MAG: hypothetical protein O3B13_25505, partial [Planctomycetota bacterium]|nr:hypothetical protein [Planctomycetota bacterium]